METHDIYQTRRQNLIQNFAGTVFIIPSGSQAKRSHSVGYRFKVASDFFYLTGLEIPDAYLILGESRQVLLRKLQHDGVWDDLDVFSEQDREKLKGIHLENSDQLIEILSELSLQAVSFALPFGRSNELETAVLRLASYDRRLRGRKIHQPLSICDSRTLVGKVRSIKSKEEIKLMREAALRSSIVHTELMKRCLTGQSELEISNWIESSFLKEDLQWIAYETIVGSGARSTLLHARATRNTIQDGDLVLIDAGGEWQGYCADITRTLPSGLEFTKEQREIYQTVLDAQKAVLEAAKPGQTLQGLHRLALQTLREGLQNLTGLKVDESLVKELMPHSTSHWIGLDVHDPAGYFDERGDEVKLQAGMCFTVEPGLYFRNQVQGFEKYLNIGIRIEDDLIITDSGCEVLTNVPKEINEIEELRKQSLN